MMLSCVRMCVLAQLHIEEEHNNNNEKPNNQARQTKVTLLHLIIQCFLIVQSSLHLLLCCNCVSPRFSNIVLYFMHGHALAVNNITQILIQFMNLPKRLCYSFYFVLPDIHVILSTLHLEFVLFFLKHLLLSILRLFRLFIVLVILLLLCMS